MMRGSIVKKLWFATALLVLLTLGIATLTQLWLLQKTYYRQQVDRLLDGAGGAAGTIAEDSRTEAVYSHLDGLAGSLQATVFLLNRGPNHLQHLGRRLVPGHDARHGNETPGIRAWHVGAVLPGGYG